MLNIDIFQNQNIVNTFLSVRRQRNPTKDEASRLFMDYLYYPRGKEKKNIHVLTMKFQVNNYLRQVNILLITYYWKNLFEQLRADV